MSTEISEGLITHLRQGGDDETKLRRIIHPEVKVIDEAKGIVEYIASDETIDSYGEIVCADGWQFNLFAKNAPFVDSHDYSTIGKLLGKVLDFTVANKRLVETVQWAIDVPENELAQLGWKMTAGGYLKAVSVGFFPVAAVSSYDGNAGPFQSLCSAKGVDPTKVRTIFTKQEQIELSGCIIGANPNALRKAARDGAITARQLLSLFPEPAEQPAAKASTTGTAVADLKVRDRNWFLGELERA
jgi:hypothetical protein